MGGTRASEISPATGTGRLANPAVVPMMNNGGAVKKGVRGGGVEKKGKTKGRFI
jgi:hypothetical protein